MNGPLKLFFPKNSFLSYYINIDSNETGVRQDSSSDIKKKNLDVISGNSGAYKSKYTLKPLLSQNMVDFT